MKRKCVPEGEYDVRITAIQKKVYTESGMYYYQFIEEFVDEQYKGLTIHHRIYPNHSNVLGSIEAMTTLGKLINMNPEIEKDIQKAVGMTIHVYVHPKTVSGKRTNSVSHIVTK